jgi:hypothetical protein
MLVRTEPYSLTQTLNRLALGVSVDTGAIRFLALLVAVELLWAHLAHIVLKDMFGSLFLVLAPIAVGLLLDALGLGKRLARMAYYLAFWLGLIFGTIFSYLCATLPFPLLDGTFAALDRSLGFDWLAWFDFVHAHALLDRILTLAYLTMLPQVLFAIVFFSHSRRQAGAEELWRTAMLALVVTALLSGLLPALGTYSYYSTLPDRAIHLPDLIALRTGTMTVFPVLELKGIITMPSFHSVMAVLLCYPYRRHRPLFVIVVALNGLMLVSVPTRGGHYLVDVIAGVAVAAAAILAYRWGMKRKVHVGVR